MGVHSVSVRRDPWWFVSLVWRWFKVATFVAGLLLYLLLIAV